MDRSRCRRTRGVAAAAALAAAQAAPAEPPAPAGPAEEIVVTGTHIPRGSAAPAASPLVVVDRDTLAGAADLAAVTDGLTINTGSQNNVDAFTQNFTTGTGNVNLRGLGVASTLVLLNGRRQTSSAAATDRGENFVDIRSLPPPIAIERVEILKDGAAAAYGSDAVAGVVNLLTRTGFEGTEVELSVADGRGPSQRDKLAAVLHGRRGERTDLLAALGRVERGPLRTSERRLSTSRDDLSGAGHPGSFLVAAAPAHPAYEAVWTSAFDTNANSIADFVEPSLGLPAVPNARPPVLADPDCERIAAAAPEVVPAFDASVPTAAGDVMLGRCAYDFGAFWSLVPRETRNAAYVELTRRIADSYELRMEMHVADNEASRDNSPSFPFARFPVVPASHPDNPFGVDVRFIGRLVGAGGTAAESVHAGDTRRAVLAAGGTTGAFEWEAAAQYSRNRFSSAVPDVLADRLEHALRGLAGPGCDASSGTPGVAPCRYFNPFGSALTGAGTANTAALLDDLLAPMRFDARSALATVDAVASREIASLRGGTAVLAFGAQQRAQRLEYDYDDDANRDNFLFLIGNPDFRDARRVDALFAELALPLAERVELRVAARREDYGAAGSTDPELTLLWRPSPSLSIRGSAGTAFRAASLYQAFGTQTTLAELVDPRTGRAGFVPVRTRPDPDGTALRPETARVLTLGVSASVGDHVELGADYWSFDYSDVIVEQSAQGILSAAAGGDDEAAAQVIRDPSGALLQRVDAYYDNASTLRTRGVDATAAYTRRAGGSAYRVGAELTYVGRYVLDDPHTGRVSGAGRRNFSSFATSVPRWRSNLLFDWRRGAHALDLAVRHIDAYADDETRPANETAQPRRIEEQLTVDLRYGYTLGGGDGPSIAVGAVNLFDAPPPHVATNGGYDSKVHDPRGRVVYARATLRF